MACIFLFLNPRLASFYKKFKFHFEIIFWFIFLKDLHLKPWFKFDYLKSNSKFPDLKILQKVYLKLS
jgi:hypothetical protein